MLISNRSIRIKMMWISLLLCGLHSPLQAKTCKSLWPDQESLLAQATVYSQNVHALEGKAPPAIMDDLQQLIAPESLHILRMISHTDYTGWRIFEVDSNHNTIGYIISVLSASPHPQIGHEQDLQGLVFKFLPNGQPLNPPYSQSKLAEPWPTAGYIEHH